MVKKKLKYFSIQISSLQLQVGAICTAGFDFVFHHSLTFNFRASTQDEYDDDEQSQVTICDDMPPLVFIGSLPSDNDRPRPCYIPNIKLNPIFYPSCSRQRRRMINKKDQVQVGWSQSFQLWFQISISEKSQNICFLQTFVILACSLQVQVTFPLNSVFLF